MKIEKYAHPLVPIRYDLIQLSYSLAMQYSRVRPVKNAFEQRIYYVIKVRIITCNKNNNK